MDTVKISSLRMSGELAKHLGNYAKSSPPLGSLDANSGVLSSEELLSLKSAKSRALRYEMQDTARNLLRADLLKTGAVDIKSIKGAHRLIHCRHTMFSKQVGTHKSSTSGKVFYSGLVTCGSVWTCPICGIIVQARRSIEVSKAINSAYENHGLTCSMITLTFPHYGFQSCKELVDKQKLALTYFRRGKSYDNLRKNLGYVGLIRALEIVYGSNGWHPHTHEIWFHTPSKMNRQKKTLKKLWFLACSKAGLIPKGKTSAFKKYAVDIKMGVSSGDYLQKSAQDGWGIDKEITRSSLKSSSKGLPPFALLESANDDNSTNKDLHGSLYVEYAKALSGKRQLYWTNGLKTLFNIDEKTDEEIAKEDQDKACQLGNFDGISWLIIRKNKARELMLYLIERGGFSLAVEWLHIHGVQTTYENK